MWPFLFAVKRFLIRVFFCGRCCFHCRCLLFPFAESYSVHPNVTGFMRTKDEQTDEQRLLYNLLRGYEKSVRPVRNASQAIVVRLGITLTHLFDLVSNVVFKFSFFPLFFKTKRSKRKQYPLRIESDVFLEEKPSHFRLFYHLEFSRDEYSPSLRSKK